MEKIPENMCFDVVVLYEKQEHACNSAPSTFTPHYY